MSSWSFLLRSCGAAWRRSVVPRARRVTAVVGALLIAAGALAVAPVAGPAGATSTAGLGGLDSSFGSGAGGTADTGYGAIAIGNSQATALALASAGDLAVAGTVTVTNSSETEMAVGLLTSAGLETGTPAQFEVGGEASTAAAVTTLASDVVVVGQTGQPSEPAIALLSATSLTLDSTWFAGSGSYAMTSFPAGAQFDAVAVSGSDVYAVGTASLTGSATTELLIARFAGGGLDTSFGDTGPGSAPGYETVPFPNGGESGEVGGVVIDGSNLVIAGSSLVRTTCTENQAFLAAFSLPSGAPDDAFTSTASDVILDPSTTSCGNTIFNALSLDSGGTGDLVAAGSSYGSESPESADSTAQGMVALYQPSSTGGSSGYSAVSAFGSAGNLVVASGTVQEFDAVALLPSSATPATPSVIVTGTEWSSPDEAFQTAIQHYSLSGAQDDTFGGSGTTLLSCEPGDSSCGGALVVQSTGAIDLTGGLAAETSGSPPVESGLAVAQLSDRSVSISGPSSDIQVSSSSAPAADFTITVTSPNDPQLSALSATGGLPVVFGTTPGTAKASTNYTTESGTVIFPCNGTFNEPSSVTCVTNQPLEATVAVPTVYPANATGSATFSMTLRSASGASIAVSSATATLEYPAQVETTTVSTVQVSTSSPPATPTTTTSTIPGKIVVVTHGTTTTTTLPPGTGYWMVTTSGRVFRFGKAKAHGSVGKKQLKGKVSAIGTLLGGDGYWLASTTGQVFAFGGAAVYGSVTRKQLHGTISAISPTYDGKGYWLVSTKGTVYPFGDAQTRGSVTAKELKGGSIVGIAESAFALGYWLLSSTGAVYPFGNASSYGSVTQQKGKPVTLVALATSANQAGYWILATNGQVYAFGTAHDYGSVPSKKLVGHAAAIIATPDTNGYWVISTHGNVYSFGDAKSYGSLKKKLGSIVGAAEV